MDEQTQPFDEGAGTKTTPPGAAHPDTAEVGDILIFPAREKVFGIFDIEQGGEHRVYRVYDVDHPAVGLSSYEQHLLLQGKLDARAVLEDHGIDVWALPAAARQAIAVPLKRNLARNLHRLSEQLALPASHPNVLQIQSIVYEEAPIERVCFFMDCAFTNLHALWHWKGTSRYPWTTQERLDELHDVNSPAFWRMVLHVSKALAFLEANGRWHGDFKPSNILIFIEPDHAYRYVLADLTPRHELRAATPVNRWAYDFLFCAPEELTHAPRSPMQDVNRFGKMLYRMVYGTPALYPERPAYASLAAFQADYKRRTGRAGSLDDPAFLAALAPYLEQVRQANAAFYDRLQRGTLPLPDSHRGHRPRAVAPEVDAALRRLLLGALNPEPRHRLRAHDLVGIAASVVEGHPPHLLYYGADPAALARRPDVNKLLAKASRLLDTAASPP